MSLCTSELSGEPVFPRTRDMYSRTPVPTGFQQTSEKRRIIFLYQICCQRPLWGRPPHPWCPISTPPPPPPPPPPSPPPALHPAALSRQKSTAVELQRWENVVLWRWGFNGIFLQFPLYQVKLARAPVNSLNLELLQVEIMDIPQFHHFSIQYNCTECLYI